MKKIVFVALLFCANQSFSQLIERLAPKDAGLKKTPNLASVYNEGKEGIFRTETTGKGDQRKFEIEHYNPDLTSAYQVSVELEKGEEYFRMDVKNGKVLVFTSLYDMKDKQVFMYVLDAATGKPIGTKQKIAFLPTDPFGVQGRTFPISFSEDGTKMLVVSSFQWAKKPQEVKAQIFETSNFKVTGSMDFPADYGNEAIKTGSYRITNEGNVFYTITTDNSKDKKMEVKQTLALYTAASKSSKYVALPFEKKKIEADYDFFRNGNYCMTGVFKDDYSKKDDKENKAGVFYFSVSATDLKITASEFNYFSADLEAKLTYKDGAKKRDLSEKEYTSRKLVQTATGVYLIENLTYTAVISNQNSTSYIPYSREFIISKFDNNGKLQFMKFIPKYASRKMYGDNIMVKDDDLYFIYCEHPKNIEKYTVDNVVPDDIDDVKDLRGPVAVCVKLDAKGALSRQILFENETWCLWPGSGVVLKEGKDLVVMEIQKDEYILEVFRVK